MKCRSHLCEKLNQQVEYGNKCSMKKGIKLALFKMVVFYRSQQIIAKVKALEKIKI